MSKTRAELDSMLDELERDLAMLVLDQADHEDLWLVFGSQADGICAQATASDLAHVKARMDAILKAQGIEPQEPAATGSPR